MGKLDGRIAIVTGSDSGIGQATAEEFAHEGASVAITYHSDEAGADETRKRVEAIGRRALVRQVDVTDEGSVRALFDAVAAALGVPDVLVNNSGTGGKQASVRDTDAASFDLVIRTNLYGPFFCCREFLRRRGDREGGKVINVTSVHEAIPSPGDAAYGASKGGLLTFTRTLALEVAPLRMTVNAIAPGQIHTPMTARTDDPAVKEREMKRIPFARPGEPWEVAKLALYLASSDADYVTGQSFTIDGGLEMNWGQGA